LVIAGLGFARVESRHHSVASTADETWGAAAVPLQKA
jgi:hypothetical protein